MNKRIKYLLENILDDFYNDDQQDILDDFLGYKYFPKNKNELREIIKQHYKNHIYNLNDIDVSQITDFSSLFSTDEYTGHKDFDVRYWDVSNGESFHHMFYSCKEFNGDLSKWNVKKGIYFYSMFYDCHNFNSNLSEWDVSNGIDFTSMFCGCTEFDANLSNWNPKKGKFLSGMFSGCTYFNSNLSQWDVSECKNFSYMFANCEYFNSDVSQWDVGNGKDFSYMFYGCYSFNQDLRKWNISDYVKNNSNKYYGMFKHCDRLNDKFIPEGIYNYK